MALAVKRVHKLPHHLSYVSMLPDIAQKRNATLISWSRITLTPGTVFHRTSSMTPLTSGKQGIHKGKGTSGRAHTVI